MLYKTENTATLLSNSISTIKRIVSFLNGVNYTVQYVPSCAPLPNKLQSQDRFEYYVTYTNLPQD